MLEKDLPLSF